MLYRSVSKVWGCNTIVSKIYDMYRIKKKAYRNTPKTYIGLFVQSTFEASTLTSTNTNLIIFGLTRPGLEPTIYHT
jgi:hypothetical protein